MKIAKESKFLRDLNDFNQDAKSIFGDTYIMSPKFVMTNPRATDIFGNHMAVHHFDMLGATSNMLVYGRNIYRILKNIKKNQISGFNIDDVGNITMDFVDISEDKFTVVENKRNVKITPNIASLYVGEIPKPKYEIRDDLFVGDRHLTEDDVKILIKNGLIKFTVNGYSARISRGLIPGLKKSHDVRVYFYNTEDADVYITSIVVRRATMTSFHTYKSFRM